MFNFLRNLVTPKKKTDFFSGRPPARTLPTRVSARGENVPQWLNPVVDKLDRNAYKYIRQSEITAQPLEKFAHLLAGFEIVVESPDPEVAAMVQENVVDKMVGAVDMLEWLAYARVEGVRFYAIDYYHDEATGWFVPRLEDGGRKKYNAGGNILFDGERIFKAREDVSFVATSESEAAELERWRFVVFKPSGDSSPEGSYELAWRAYSFVTEYENAIVAMREYTKRWANPFAWIAQNLDSVDAQSYATRAEAVARKFINAPKDIVVSDSLIRAIEIVEPSGNTSTFLQEYRRLLRAEAQQAVLGQDLTSTTAESGPTGSSGEAKDTEAQIIKRFSKSLGASVSRDLGAFIRRMNPYFLKDRAGFTLKLVQPKATKAATVADVVSLLQQGVPFKSEFVYEAVGAERPEGSPDVIEGTKPAASPMLGFGLPPREPDDPKALSARAGQAFAPHDCRSHGTPYSLKKNAPRDSEHRTDLAILFAAIEREAVEEMSRSWRSVLGMAFEGRQGRVGKALISTVSKAKALAYLAGIVKIAGQLDFETGGIVPSKSPPMIDVVEKFIDKKVGDAVLTAAKELNVPEAFARKIVDKVRSEETATVRPISERLNAEAREAKRLYDVKKFEEKRANPDKLITQSEADFVRFVEKEKPDVAASSARLVFRNESAEAYRQGAEEGMRRIEPFAGGWQYHSVGDGAVRPSHAALDGKVFPINRRELMPPFAFNCRCTFTIVGKDFEDEVLDSRNVDALIMQTKAAGEGLL